MGYSCYESMIITEFSGILILQSPTNIDLEHRPSQEEGVCLLERCLICIANENSSNVLHADIEIRDIYIYIYIHIHTSLAHRGFIPHLASG